MLSETDTVDLRHNAMTFSLIALLMALVFGADAHAWAPEPETRVSVKVRSTADIAVLEAIPAEIEERHGDRVEARLPVRLLANLDRLGLSYTVLVPDLRAAHFRAEGVCEPCGEWHDHDWFVAVAEDCETNHPDICRAEVIGETVAGRPIVAVKVSDNVADDEAEPEVLFEGSIHGNEVIGAEVNAHLVRLLTEGYGGDPDLTSLVDERETWFVLSTNPDGLCACSRYNDNGVDMNRDMGFAWRANGSSPDPLSQPETRALFDLAREHGFVFATSWHGGAEEFIYAWSYIEQPPLDAAEYEWLGADYVALHPLIDVYQQSAYFYATPYWGSSKDTFYGSLGALGWTIELSEIKAPPFAEYATWMADNEAPSLRLIERAGAQGMSGVFTDADSGDPVGAWVEVDGRMMGYASEANGDWHRFLTPGTYDVAISARGHEPRVLGDVVVAAEAVTDISAELEPSGDARPFASRWLYNFTSSAADTTAQAFFALGAPDGRGYPLGIKDNPLGTGERESFVVFDMGRGGFVDAPGNDIAVYPLEEAKGYAYALAASDDAYGPWTPLGEGSGRAGFDLAAGPLPHSRYVRVESRTVEGDLAPGMMMDAVGGPDPRAAFEADVTTGAAPLAVSFTDASESLSPVQSYGWEFGDGWTSSETSPTHTYADPGVYDVTLTVESNNGSDTWRRAAYIVVTDAPDDDTDDDTEGDDDVDDDAETDDDAGKPGDHVSAADEDESEGCSC